MVHGVEIKREVSIVALLNHPNVMTHETARGISHLSGDHVNEPFRGEDGVSGVLLHHKIAKGNHPVTFVVAACGTHNVNGMVLPSFGLSEGSSITSKEMWGKMAQVNVEVKLHTKVMGLSSPRTGGLTVVLYALLNLEQLFLWTVDDPSCLRTSPLTMTESKVLSSRTGFKGWANGFNVGSRTENSILVQIFQVAHSRVSTLHSPSILSIKDLGVRLHGYLLNIRQIIFVRASPEMVPLDGYL
ncbi:non-lysosomal glucosylceramidase [Tanacetum coccineum]|uniref:Non-lysosomal glucosylceramidase n=1 Tax=Tanacetum coccineum TaxID=301880 RepID=A0ABQ4XMQ3_9ASTR